MKKIIFLVCIALLAACHKDDDNDEQEDLPGRTVLVYMSGENSLSYTAPVDLQEMKEGSKKMYLIPFGKDIKALSCLNLTWMNFSAI